VFSGSERLVDDADSCLAVGSSCSLMVATASCQRLLTRFVFLQQIIILYRIVCTVVCVHTGRLRFVNGPSLPPSPASSPSFLRRRSFGTLHSRECVFIALTEVFSRQYAAVGRALIVRVPARQSTC
jgi:hypothetical protein